jgi:hypothetical protein
MRVKTGRRETCTYCLEKIPRSEITSDHVIAESWYTPRAEDFEKWQVPSCQSCNGALGNIERELLVRFALCLDVTEPAYADIMDRARRAIDPTFGKNRRDARSRARLRQQLSDEIRRITRFDEPGVLPFFETNFLAGGRDAIPIPADSIEIVAQKWARGLYRLRFNQLIPLAADCDINFLRQDAEWEAFAPLVPLSTPMHRGDDLQAMLCRGKDVSREGFYVSFRIWKEFKVHCVLMFARNRAD